MISLLHHHRRDRPEESRDSYRLDHFLVLLGILLLVAACGRAVPAEMSTQAPTAIAYPPPTVRDTVGLALTSAPTTTSPPFTAAPTATTAPSPTPCALPVLPALQPAYLDIELGCPLNPGLDPLTTAYAPFEGGQMLWRQDNAVIYVLTNDGRWAQYDDLWREGDAEFTCGESNNPPTPVRGFGRVWCDWPAVRQSLGAATAAEIGDAGGRAQDFANGMLLASPDGSTFVLVGESATWRRVWPND